LLFIKHFGIIPPEAQKLPEQGYLKTEEGTSELRTTNCFRDFLAGIYYPKGYTFCLFTFSLSKISVSFRVFQWFKTVNLCGKCSLTQN